MKNAFESPVTDDGMIDIRIWQLLDAYNQVDYDEQGNTLTVLCGL